MKLPDWTSEKTSLYLIGGSEVIAKNIAGSGWEMKVSRCSRCGACCIDSPKGFEFHDPEKGCIYLLHNPDGTTACGAPEQPYSCVRGDGQDMPSCTVRFTEWL